MVYFIHLRLTVQFHISFVVFNIIDMLKILIFGPFFNRNMKWGQKGTELDYFCIYFIYLISKCT